MLRGNRRILKLISVLEQADSDQRYDIKNKQELIKNLNPKEPIFVNKKIYNSTINDILQKHCKNADIPVITIHGLRHTHASLLLYAGVSIASVAHRLGHASMSTTQKTYLHIIHLEPQLY